MDAESTLTTYTVQVHGLYLGKQVLTVETETEDEALDAARKRWHKLFKGVRGAIWRIGLAPEEGERTE
jgi:hypothetical protein